MLALKQRCDSFHKMNNTEYRLSANYVIKHMCLLKIYL